MKLLTCNVCGKELRADNKIGVCRKHRTFSLKTKERVSKWHKENAEKVKTHKRKYAHEKGHKKVSERRKTDIEFRMTGNIRNRINKVAKLKGKNKVYRKIEKLGCTMLELKKYLESKFKPGMSWDNYGINGWHIDHIYPLSKVDFNDEEALNKAIHYTNLQPLWSIENIIKRDKI